MNLFGKKKAPPIAPKLTDSIQMLRQAQDTLEKREKYLEKQIAICKDEAREKLKNKDRRGALHLMKRAKLIEKEINQIYGKKDNIDVQIIALEGAASNRDLVNVMRVGRDALKAATSELDVDRVANVMDDITENIQMADEINEQLSQSIGQPVDEDELNAELAEMENELLDSELLSAPSVPVTQVQSNVVVQPSVTSSLTSAPAQATSSSSSSSAPPTTKTANLSKKEQDELKELEAMMNI